MCLLGDWHSCFICVYSGYNSCSGEYVMCLQYLLVLLLRSSGIFQGQYTGYTQKNGAVSNLTRNLFLTLHGHNAHRQQRQLSKFLMHYQQFASHAYCGTAGPVSKLASQQEKSFCVLRCEASRSVFTVQREFRARFKKDAPRMLLLF